MEFSLPAALFMATAVHPRGEMRNRDVPRHSMRRDADSISTLVLFVATRYLDYPAVKRRWKRSAYRCRITLP